MDNPEPFLILHKVRGEPAFDVAHQMDCPECHDSGWGDGKECDACEGQGYWWIVSTSGHRAYPVRYWALSELADISDINAYNNHNRPYYMDDIPADWPDHYSCNDRRKPEPAKPSNILRALGLAKEFVRRI
jgi:hypothetical protein